jgi:hypothetical protein
MLTSLTMHELYLYKLTRGRQITTEGITYLFNIVGSSVSLPSGKFLNILQIMMVYNTEIH